MKTLKILALMLAAMMLFVVEAMAASTTAGLTVNATVGNSLKLELGGGANAAINFSDADPDNVTSIPANENALSVAAKARVAPLSVVTLTCLASADLVSGGNTIGINNVTWTVGSGSGFQAGTMSKGAAQTAGSWSGPAEHNGSFNYFLANSWGYAPGSYSATVTYTLTSP